MSVAFEYDLCAYMPVSDLVSVLLLVLISAYSISFCICCAVDESSAVLVTDKVFLRVSLDASNWEYVRSAS